ncbi:FAD-binding oxidoreductase [Streptomyces gibsoniae]|uniref:FAD-linked oxidase C-terminal domain-containing protein n=1 Tax=Streptomyces gibsoniae TaxID=3075529 RepID=A0ABU2TY65_9ACTN|nr:FAD-linked oxidase C-terminal domain-containing protein [Streptomyces sp. DSM 41699]MDT0465762.1 FAD-linked oxidase C-terminal domain-containing protein [Streptomyces sp. DSM 41699]
MTTTSSDLAQLLPAGRVIGDPARLASFAHDEAAGASYALPTAVVQPRDTADVAAVVAYCAERGVPVVARGAGTGLSGGANATDGCVVVSFAAMNRIVHIDPDERLAVVQPGVVNDDLRAACAAKGLWYPPDPASAPWSTIGGNVATNAGGLCCVKYGVTRDYVLGLEAVTGRGEVVRLGRRTAKSSAGFELAGLLVGSEGTLGLVTEVTLRLRGERAQEHTVVGYFDDLPSAGRAVAQVVACGVVPSALELVDRYCLQAVDAWKNMGLTDSGNVLLLARCDAPGAAGAEEAGTVLACFEAAGATWAARSGDPTESEALFAARRLVYPALDRLGMVLSEDICVPRSLVPDMLARLERTARRHGVRIAGLAHAGDGNLHPMLVVPRGDERELAKGREVFEEVVDQAIALGGTVTGEHGVGLLKRRGLAKEFGPAVMDLHRGIKDVWDPAGILNPGKIFTA